MLASTFFDLVIGVDLHRERLLLEDTPLPFPHPFIGLIFDPLLGLEALMPHEEEEAAPGLVLIHNMPAATVGMEARNCFILPHFIVAPGTEWAALSNASGQMVLPPPGDALLHQGSAKVRAMGAALCRSGDSALSCSEPERLPSAYILPIPKGMPVLLSGEETVEAPQADASAPVPMKLRWSANPLKQRIGRIKSSRVRNLVPREACTLKGHGVDIATGRVCLRARDLGEGDAGAIFERHYLSAFCDRQSALGYGWTHSLDERIWIEPGCVVYRAEDGRELTLDTFEMDGREIPVGESVVDTHHRLTLRRLGPMQWELGREDGSIRHFGPVKGDAAQQGRLLWWKSRLGHGLELRYDERGLLRWARDTAGMVLQFAYDQRDRMVGAALSKEPRPELIMETRFYYSAEGDLIEAVDMRGAKTSYEYASHLLVRETDPAGNSYYFGYDGRGPLAYCLRAWDSAGSYDEVMDYDKAGRISYVTDSLGKTVMYVMDAGYAIREVKASSAYLI